jgi:hypothetical protein
MQHMTVPAATPEKSPKRTYSDDFIAHALAMVKANGGNVLKTSLELGIPRLTLYGWYRQTRRNTPEIEQLQHEKAANLAKRFETAAGLYLDHAMDPVSIGVLNGLEATKAAAINVDKMQLLRGQPTSIVEERTIDSRQVLVLLAESMGLPDPHVPQRDPITAALNITPTPAAPAIDTEIADSVSDPAAAQTESRFTRLMRGRRESSHVQS